MTELTAPGLSGANAARPAKASAPRLLEIDALRGLAAMAVVLFHYTARLQELHPAAGRTLFSVPWGQYGVNLFFILSGFVIFMTLERCKSPMDFVVSRFSRLYPAYWFSVALTFGILAFVGLDGWNVRPVQALANLLMFHGLFFIPHVDAVYWTLEVELLFYCGMLFLYWRGALRRAWLVCLLLLTLRVVYFLCATLWQINLSWSVSRFLILPHVPWFALGIAIYLHVQQRNPRDRFAAAALTVAALVSLAVEDSLPIAVLALALAAVVLMAARGSLPMLELRPFVWLGAVSYPLYLLHENIGWSLILHAVRAGMPTDFAVVLAIGMSMLLAQAVSILVERPAMRRIRTNYLGRSASR